MNTEKPIIQYESFRCQKIQLVQLF